MRLFLVCVFAAALAAQPKKLLVVSVDGLDTRYLHNADRLGLRIPTLRRLVAEGAVASGVVGIVPTVTWPSHTTILTGVPSDEHGIVSNDQPGKPGQRWWFVSFLKARTLWHAAREKKMKTAAVYWPVTAGAAIDFNFPEFWYERAGHETLFAPIAEKATPGLEERVARVYPSFPRSQWTDTSAMQAVRYLVEFEKPDLTLVHIADLDSEQHDHGAFGKNAKAVLEHADTLIGWVLEKLPPQTIVAIVSDHGFDNAEKLVRPRVMLPGGNVEIS
ncbi:MAG: ectonucleotide pyrophosphatase/phosphodiesterase, partial [Bryobacteraceae bacterium]